MTSLGFIESTATVSVTDAPSTFAVEAPTDARRRYVISSDVAFHVSRNSDATTDAMRVPASTLATVSMFGGDSLSVVKATGEDNGTLWVTQSG